MIENTPNAAHAVLSASSSHRWLMCPPSALLCAELPDTSSEYAQQGTDAHTLCEYKLNKALGADVKDPTLHLQNYDAEMNDCADEYAQYVLEKVTESLNRSDITILVEQKLDFSKWVPGGFGTGDCVIIADGTLYVIDFKYGVGVLVDAEMNPQMMCYALGALNSFDMIYDIENISMTIFQPRRDNVSTFVMSKSELLAWAENTLKPTAELAAKGEGEFCAGEHCQFCKVKATCRKRAEYNLELAKYDFAMPDTLGDDEIEMILEKADALISWADDIKQYAFDAALRGKQWQNWKLVEGRSNRKYIDEDAVADVVKKAGYKPYEQKLLGITAMTSLLGKKKFNELLSELIEKPRGKPVLVPVSDKRPAMNTAADDFENLEEEN